MEPTSIPNSAPQADGNEPATSPRPSHTSSHDRDQTGVNPTAKPIKLVHLTDAHASDLRGTPARALLGKRALGYLSWWRKRRHQHHRAVLDKITQQLLVHEPDLIVITGDLIHLGLQHEMRQLRSWLSELSERSRVLLVPGNHDLYRQDSEADYTAVWGDLPIFGRSTAPSIGTVASAPDLGFSDTWPAVVDLGDVRVIGLCSAYAAPWRKADGHIGSKQLERLDQCLTAAQNRYTVIALHHPVTQQGVSARKALTDAPALTALLEKHSVSVVVHGHLHDNLEYRTGGTICFCTAPASSTYACTPSHTVKDASHTADHTTEQNCVALTSGSPGRPYRRLPAVFRTLEFGARDAVPTTQLHRLA